MHFSLVLPVDALQTDISQALRIAYIHIRSGSRKDDCKALTLGRGIDRTSQREDLSTMDEQCQQSKQRESTNIRPTAQTRDSATLSPKASPTSTLKMPLRFWTTSSKHQSLVSRNRRIEDSCGSANITNTLVKRIETLEQNQARMESLLAQLEREIESLKQAKWAPAGSWTGVEEVNPHQESVDAGLPASKPEKMGVKWAPVLPSRTEPTRHRIDRRVPDTVYPRLSQPEKNTQRQLQQKDARNDGPSMFESRGRSSHRDELRAESRRRRSQKCVEDS